jgi:hypothetical protein
VIHTLALDFSCDYLALFRETMLVVKTDNCLVPQVSRLSANRNYGLMPDSIAKPTQPGPAALWDLQFSVRLRKSLLMTILMQTLRYRQLSAADSAALLYCLFSKAEQLRLILNQVFGSANCEVTNIKLEGNVSA